MVHVDLQTRAIQDVDIKRFVQNRVRYADLHETIAEQIKSDVEVKMDEQPGLSTYEVVQEVLKTYNRQRLDTIISKEKKAMRKDWMWRILYEIRTILLYPGIFIFAIAATVCYFTTGYFENYTDIPLPGLILVFFLLIGWAYYFYSTYAKNHSGEKKLLKKYTFRYFYNIIFISLLIIPGFAMDIVDFFWGGAANQFLEINLWYSLWFAYICTMLYVMWRVYGRFYPQQIDIQESRIKSA